MGGTKKKLIAGSPVATVEPYKLLVYAFLLFNFLQEASGTTKTAKVASMKFNLP